MRWDEATLQPPGTTDTAAPKGNARRAATLRQLRAELAKRAGRHNIQLLWDIEGFFDHLDLERVAEQAWGLGMEPDLLALFLQLHLAPRVLEVDGCMAEPMAIIGRSILMGCTSSTRLARSVTSAPLHASQATPMDEGTSLTQGVHVDDVSQQLVGDVFSLVAASAERAATALAAGIRRMGLTPSPKSHLVASSRALARAVANQLAARGVTIAAEANGEYLGVTAVAGVRRSGILAAKRETRGTLRARRVNQLQRWNNKSQRLFRTGVRPVSDYGLEGQGYTPIWRYHARVAAASCAGRKGVIPCAFSTVAYAFGAVNDPFVFYPTLQIRTWATLWSEDMSAQGRADAVRVWEPTCAALRALPAQARWRTVTGALSATVLTLLEHGWDPCAPDLWRTPDGLQEAVFTPDLLLRHQVVRAFEATVEASQ